MDAPFFGEQGCKVPGCDRKYAARGYCSTHYARLLRGETHEQIAAKPVRRVSGNGWHVDGAGYMVRTLNGRQLRQHREVMAEILGRPLLSHEEPHHKNGDRSDNRPSNLELWSTSQPKGQRVKDKLAWAHELIALYEGE